MRIGLNICLMICAAIVFLTPSAQAQNFDHSVFSKLPVLHEGRVKPLDSYARIHLKKWTGSDSYQNRSPSEWLSMILFDPTKAAQEDLFIIRDQDVLRQLGMEGAYEQRYFSLESLSPAINATKDKMVDLLNADQDSLTLSQKTFLDLHENVAALSNMMRSFSIILPLDVELPEVYKERFEGQDLNYLMLFSIETPLVESLQNIIKAKGDDPQNYSAEEKKIALLAFQLQTLRAAGERNNKFKIMPLTWGDDNAVVDDWFSPWTLILSGQGSPQNSEYLKNWQDMAGAYRSNDNALWSGAVNDAAAHIGAQNLYSPFLFDLEIFYNTVHPYNWARGLFALGVLLIGLSLASSKTAIFRLGAIISISLATAALSLAITSRVLILDRPPVGTLYESVLFVAVICALGGLLAAIWRRNDLALLAGAISALGLLFVAPVIVPEGESLEVLVAVLNTNFWLATHVTIITAGYGVCMIAACMAHFYMLARLSKDKKDAGLLKLNSAIYKTSIVALLLTAVGTVLGGIWADQSWGRFWGWDPKENGALLIVLWLIWIQHGRLSGHLRELPFMAAMAFLNVIVAVAWFGVNLLGVGLHSYGFTSGIAVGLAVFCAVETAFIVIIWMAVRLKEKGAKYVA